MTRLTRAKQMTRVGGIGLGIAFVVYLVIRITLNMVFSLNTNHSVAQKQAKASLPTVSFGQIPAPQLKTATVSTGTATVQLDLVNGDFPQSTTSARVYKVATPALSLSAQDRARDRGAQLGFAGTPDQPTPTSFTWTDAWRTLNINLTDQTFALTSRLPQVDFSQRTTFNQFTALGQPVGQYANQLFGYKDVNFSTPQIRYVNPAGNSVLPQDENAVTPTNFAQISFLRQQIDGLPVYSAAGKLGPINMVVIPPMKAANGRDNSSQVKLDQIVQLSSQYFPIDSSASSTYPIITPQDAFNALQANIGQYLVSVEPTGTTLPKTFTNGRVLFVNLVYLEPDSQNRQFVQPAWMFEGRAITDQGNAQWVAYVPAIDQDLTRQILSTKK